MRWRTYLKLVICGVLVVISFILYWALEKNLSFSEWIGLIGILVAGTVASMTFLDKYFGIFKKIREAELKHSEDLIRDVFEKPIAVCDVVYDEDKILLSQKEDISGQIIIWQVDYNKDRVHQSCVEWNEANPMLEYAIQHLNHKKYERTWQAYINGKQYAETLINKIVENIEQYREIVKYNLHKCKTALTIRKKENVMQKGEYSQKRINHLIFYDVLKKLETGTSDKQLELFLVDFTGLEDIYHLEWCDRDLWNTGVIIGGKIVATGDRKSMENLQIVIEQIENDKEIINAVLEIDALKINLKNNSELKIFEEGRLEIVNQVKIIKEGLAGECDRCP